MNPIIFITTGADIEPYIERYVEYMFSLHKIFSYNIPVYGVLSECSTIYNSKSAPFDKFPFNHLLKISSGDIQAHTKSLKEYMAIQLLLQSINSSSISDDTFVIKVSGRYLLIDDTFVNLVKETQSHLSIASIFCKSQINQQYSFLYAMRYKYFKLFYSNVPALLAEGHNIEEVLQLFLNYHNLIGKSIEIDHLGILTNIDNHGGFVIY
uniref:Uncharacterized protein n=1 Tax=viral metagenome TaxID=1070528 RepID=A0A6C0K914_9ZZZZ